MTFDALSPRHSLLVGFLAVVPLLWYALEGSLTAGLVSVLNVILILAGLYVAFQPVDGHGSHASGDTTS
ncbi:cytochrome-ba3 oxidase subunit [Natrarchaeobaculum sulfurireducens]|uniref:cytochrome-ba3 oxidase subunit n=1 Tax=Natrarchaeobaculum sulfurireducens TaxID=2044521 RepID=UPI000E3CFBB2|nr:cytochrome-ba3 oxidase subunit [Natrarchaeobaculum sulfurireducens]